MALRRLLANSLFWCLIVVAFTSGVTLLVAVLWLQPLTDAEEARRAGNPERALDRYAAAGARFDRLSAAKRIARGVYQTGQSNELGLLYSRKEYDAIIEKTEGNPLVPAAHYWAGCAFFRKALVENRLDARTTWFRRAEEEFKRAMELDPADWDSKFNYEISRRVRNMAQKQPNTPPAEFLKILRPQTAPDKRPGKRTG